jgi:hypothetical protein
MAQITNQKRITSPNISPVDDDIGIPRLDIYIGYTEELLKTCGRISELQSLKDDISALQLAVASMWANPSILREFTYIDRSIVMKPLRPGPTPQPVASPRRA